ncbi:MAG: HPF/RaiA family ribosome-associated protein [Planctomycetes bacterium]|nr:HPF/RaiA family ribosome-associated protein [Planctomycetota bacterium]
MKIQINAPNVDVPEALSEFIESRTHEVLGHFEKHLTRVEIHLKDQNGDKGGVDMHCTVEVRPRGLDPMAVDHTAESEADAVRKALDKMKSALDRRLGRLSER